jgi:hypothetical protein
MLMTRPFFLLSILLFLSCKNNSSASLNKPQVKAESLASPEAITQSPGTRTIHVFVALCDNKYQGIVPVPATIGNGQDPRNNLYWGAGYGVKTYFSKSADWKLISSQKNPEKNILERVLFKHKSKKVYLLADAYDGQFIYQATVDFLQASSGNKLVEQEIEKEKIYFGGAANLVGYVGHDGLMDFTVQQQFAKNNDEKREAIILACYSKKYFSKHLKATGADPLLWTSGLMAPEAYTLHDAIREWVNENPSSEIRQAAAAAYARYQKCNIKAARNLLIQGW